MTRVAADLAFLSAGGETVVNVTLSPHHGLAGMTHSSAARAAVEGYTREWADRGITVMAVAAGHFDTASLPKYPEPVWRAAARDPAPAPGPRGGARVAGRALLLRRSAPRSRARPSRSTARATLVRPVAAAVARRGREEVSTEARGRSLPGRDRAGYHPDVRCGRSVVVAQKPSKLLGRVRFPSPACETATGSGAVW
jgi:NAD(P)-dependent dehydrogenase (short-subunit alcohol dehydrogenase family)